MHDPQTRIVGGAVVRPAARLAASCTRPKLLFSANSIFRFLPAVSISLLSPFQIFQCSSNCFYYNMTVFASFYSRLDCGHTQAADPVSMYPWSACLVISRTSGTYRWCARQLIWAASALSAAAPSLHYSRHANALSFSSPISAIYSLLRALCAKARPASTSAIRLDPAPCPIRSGGTLISPTVVLTAAHCVSINTKTDVLNRCPPA